MIHLQNVKFLNLIPPVAIKDNAAFVTTERSTYFPAQSTTEHASVVSANRTTKQATICTT